MYFYSFQTIMQILKLINVKNYPSGILELGFDITTCG